MAAEMVVSWRADRRHSLIGLLCLVDGGMAVGVSTAKLRQNNPC